MTSLAENDTVSTPTAVTSLPGVVAGVRHTFGSRVTRPLSWRKKQLERMIAMLEENEAAFTEALATDLGKPDIEGYITDIAFVIGDVSVSAGGPNGHEALTEKAKAQVREHVV